MRPLCFLVLRLAAHRGAARVPYPGRRVRTCRCGLCVSGSSPGGSSRCGPGPLPGPPSPHLSVRPLCFLVLRLAAHRGAARVPYPGRRVRTCRCGLCVFWFFAWRLIAVRPGSLTRAAESAPVGAASVFSGSSPGGSSRCGPGPLPGPPSPHLSVRPLCFLVLRLAAHRGAAQVPYPGRRARTCRCGLCVFWFFAWRLIAVRPRSLTRAAESAPVGAASVFSGSSPGGSSRCGPGP